MNTFKPALHVSHDTTLKQIKQKFKDLKETSLISKNNFKLNGITNLLNNTPKSFQIHSSKFSYQELFSGTAIEIQYLMENYTANKQYASETHLVSKNKHVIIPSYSEDNSSNEEKIFSLEKEINLKYGFLVFNLDDSIQNETQSLIPNINPKLQHISPFLNKNISSLENSNFVKFVDQDKIHFSTKKTDFNSRLPYSLPSSDSSHAGLFCCFIPQNEINKDYSKKFLALNIMNSIANTTLDNMENLKSLSQTSENFFRIDDLVNIPLSISHPQTGELWYCFPLEYFHVRRIFPRITLNASDKISLSDIKQAFLTPQTYQILSQSDSLWKEANEAPTSKRLVHYSFSGKEPSIPTLFPDNSNQEIYEKKLHPVLENEYNFIKNDEVEPDLPTSTTSSTTTTSTPQPTSSSSSSSSSSATPPKKLSEDVPKQSTYPKKFIEVGGTFTRPKPSPSSSTSTVLDDYMMSKNALFLDVIDTYDKYSSAFVDISDVYINNATWIVHLNPNKLMPVSEQLEKDENLTGTFTLYIPTLNETPKSGKTSKQKIKDYAFVIITCDILDDIRSLKGNVKSQKIKNISNNQYKLWFDINPDVSVSDFIQIEDLNSDSSSIQLGTFESYQPNNKGIGDINLTNIAFKRFTGNEPPDSEIVSNLSIIKNPGLSLEEQETLKKQKTRVNSVLIWSKQTNSNELNHGQNIICSFDTKISIQKMKKTTNLPYLLNIRPLDRSIIFMSAFSHGVNLNMFILDVALILDLHKIQFVPNFEKPKELVIEENKIQNIDELGTNIYHWFKNTNSIDMINRFFTSPYFTPDATKLSLQTKLASSFIPPKSSGTIYPNNIKITLMDIIKSGIEREIENDSNITLLGKILKPETVLKLLSLPADDYVLREEFWNDILGGDTKENESTFILIKEISEHLIQFGTKLNDSTDYNMAKFICDPLNPSNVVFKDIMLFIIFVENGLINNEDLEFVDTTNSLKKKMEFVENFPLYHFRLATQFISELTTTTITLPTLQVWVLLITRNLSKLSNPFYFSYFSGFDDIITNGQDAGRNLFDMFPSWTISLLNDPEVITNDEDLEVIKTIFKKDIDDKKQIVEQGFYHMFIGNIIGKDTEMTIMIEQSLSRILNQNILNKKTKFYSDEWDITKINDLNDDVKETYFRSKYFKALNKIFMFNDNGGTDFLPDYTPLEVVFQKNAEIHTLAYLLRHIQTPSFKINVPDIEIVIPINHQVQDLASGKIFDNNKTFFGQAIWTNGRNDFYKPPSSKSFASFMTRENQIDFLLDYLKQNKIHSSLASVLMLESINNWALMTKFDHKNSKNIPIKLLSESLLIQLEEITAVIGKKCEFKKFSGTDWIDYIFSTDNSTEIINRLYSTSFNFPIIILQTKNKADERDNISISIYNNIRKMFKYLLIYKTSQKQLILGIRNLFKKELPYNNNVCNMRLIWALVLEHIVATYYGSSLFQTPDQYQFALNFYTRSLPNEAMFEFMDEITTKPFNGFRNFFNYHYCIIPSINLFWNFVGVLPESEVENLTNLNKKNEFQKPLKTNQSKMSKNNIYVYQLSLPALGRLDSPSLPIPSDLDEIEITVPHISSNGILLPTQFHVIRIMMYLLKAKNFINWFYIDYQPNFITNKDEIKIYMRFATKLLNEKQLVLNSTVSLPKKTITMNPLSFNFSSWSKSDYTFKTTHDIKKETFNELEWYQIMSALSFEEISTMIVPGIKDQSKILLLGMQDPHLQKMMEILFGSLDPDFSGINSEDGIKPLLTTADFNPSTKGFSMSVTNKKAFLTENRLTKYQPPIGFGRNFEKPAVILRYQKTNDYSVTLVNENPNLEFLPLISQRFLNRVIVNNSGVSDLGLLLSGAWESDLKGKLATPIPYYRYFTFLSNLQYCTLLPFERLSFTELHEKIFKKFCLFVKNEWQLYLINNGIKGTLVQESKVRLSKLVQISDDKVFVDNYFPEQSFTLENYHDEEVGENGLVVRFIPADVMIYHHYNNWLIQYENLWCNVIVPKIFEMSIEGIEEELLEKDQYTVKISNEIKA